MNLIIQCDSVKFSICVCTNLNYKNFFWFFSMKFCLCHKNFNFPELISVIKFCYKLNLINVFIRQIFRYIFKWFKFNCFNYKIFVSKSRVFYTKRKFIKTSIHLEIRISRTKCCQKFISKIIRIYVELTVIKLKNKLSFFVSFELILLARIEKVRKVNAIVSTLRVQVPVDHSYKYENEVCG